MQGENHPPAGMDAPAHDLFEQLTTSNLVASLQSAVCPACARAKITRQTFCSACYRQLPQLLRTALYTRIGHGYERHVMAAMRFLGRAQFLLPCRVLKVAIGTLRLGECPPPRILELSLASLVCPRCCAVKAGWDVLCPACCQLLGTAVYTKYCRRGSGMAKRLGEEYFARLTRANLADNLDDYTNAIRQAFSLLKQRTFFYPKEA